MTITDQAPPVQRPTISSQYPYRTLVPTSYPFQYPYVSVPATPYLQPHQAVHNPSIRNHPSLHHHTSPTFTRQHVSVYSPQSPQVFTQPPPPRILLPSGEPANLPREHPLMFSSYGSSPSLTGQPIGAVDSGNISSLHGRDLPGNSQLPSEFQSRLSQQQTLSSSSSLTGDCRRQNNQPVSEYDATSVVSISESDQRFRIVSVICY